MPRTERRRTKKGDATYVVSKGGTIADAAYDVLKHVGRPMRVIEILDAIPPKRRGRSRTPGKSLSVALQGVPRVRLSDLATQNKKPPSQSQEPSPASDEAP